MNREIHVRFWEGLGVRFPWATQLPSSWVGVSGDPYVRGNQRREYADYEGQRSFKPKPASGKGVHSLDLALKINNEIGRASCRERV